jgi:hypothetical protein
MNTIAGAFFLAVSNIVLTSFSPSPTYLEVRTEDVMLNRVDLKERKLAFSVLFQTSKQLLKARLHGGISHGTSYEISHGTQ